MIKGKIMKQQKKFTKQQSARVAPVERLLSQKENSYQLLKEIARTFANNVKYRHTALMFELSKDDIKSSGYSLLELYERTLAAQQLGYDVVLSVENDRLKIKYVKQPPPIPFEIEY